MSDSPIIVRHFSNWAPNRSGLYACTRELVEYERKFGLDSEMAIFETENPPETMIDGTFRPVSWEETKKANVFVLHRGIPGPLEYLKKPTVCVIHGTPAFLIQEEVISHAEKTPFNTHINLLKDCVATVAVNPLDFDIYKLYDGKNKLTMIHDAIDTNKYTIEGYQYPYSNMVYNQINHNHTKHILHYLVILMMSTHYYNKKHM